MKNLFIKTVAFFCIIVNRQVLAHNNPLFDNYKDQLTFHLAFSSKSKALKNLYDIKPENLYMMFFQYSQLNPLFRLNGRGNFEVIFLKGFKSSDINYSQYSQLIVGLSQDIILPLPFDHFYIGAGLGIYIKQKATARIGSAFTFGQKYFTGFNFKRFNFELFIKHFSNGGLTEINKGQDFVGIAFSYNFNPKTY